MDLQGPKDTQELWKQPGGSIMAAQAWAGHHTEQQQTELPPAEATTPAPGLRLHNSQVLLPGEGRRGLGGAPQWDPGT